MKFAAMVSIFTATGLSLVVGTSGAMAAEAAAAASPTDVTLQRGLDLAEKKQYKGALDLWIPLAAQGVAQAQFYIAVAYSNGAGEPKDPVRAVEWLTRAANKGLAEAEVQLGICFANGAGVATDKSKAVTWYRKAADQGDADGQVHLGLMYSDGTGVPKDSAQAVALYRKASAQGDAKGQYFLGEAYWNGEGVEKDPNQALELFQKSAKQGFEYAKVMAETVAVLIRGEAAAARGMPSTAFPSTPGTRPGVTSCNTRCNNGQCLRTYDDGRHVQFQAEHRFNAMTNEWEWDSGTC